MSKVTMSSVSMQNDILYIEGDLVFATVPKLLQQTKPLLERLCKNGRTIQADENNLACTTKPTKTIQIDLAKVKYADSSALALFCSWQRFAKKNNLSCQFLNVPSQLVNIAKLTSVNNIFDI